MTDRLSTSRHSFAHLNSKGKRDYLQVLSDLVWDIETQLAKAKAERAALMSSLQADMHQQSEEQS